MAIHITPQTLLATADRVALHAQLVQDFNPLHLDEAFAAQTPFGGAIVHGSMMMNLLVDTLERAGGRDFAAGDLNLRFAAPVRVGHTITAGGEPADDGNEYTVWVKRSDGTVAVSGVFRPGDEN